MKPYLFFITAFAFVVLYGCKREDVNPHSGPVKTPNATGGTSNNVSTGGAVAFIDPTKLIGKWSLAKDSTFSYIDTAMIHTKVYIGTADDYFDFRINGKVYISENGVLDSMSFGMPTDTTVVFDKSNGVQISGNGTATSVPTLQNVINPFTSNSARITYVYLVGPGGTFGRTVYLIR